MNISGRRETAKIYQFPRRPRLVSTGSAAMERTEPARLHAICDTGAGWYHEAAIQEDARARKD